MLDHLDSALSPVGLATFLHGPVESHLRRRAKERFASEGDDASGKWAPLQQSTIEFRESGGFGPRPINRRTGELEAYITQSDADITSVPGLSTLVYPKDQPGTSGLRQKVQTAQGGRSEPRTVARPVLALSENDLAAVMVQLAFHIQAWRGNP